MAETMKVGVNIIHGGGWIIRQKVGKPKALFFTFLSILGLAISVIASIAFWDGLPKSFSWYHWLCLSLLAAEAILIVLAIVFWILEPSRTVSKRRSNPDYDSHNLY
jgi:hypothetical protein